MYKQDGRHTVLKIPVSGLVAIMLHTQNAAEAAAKQCDFKKRSLRDAKGTPDGSFFVYAHDCKADDVDDT